MTHSWGTANIFEILWTVLSIPGLIVWGANLRSARRDLWAVRSSGIIDGRFLWAKFASLLNLSFLVMEFIFAGIGVVGMLTAPVVPNAPITATSYAITIGATVAYGLMTFVGLRWRQVNRYIIGAARVRAEVDYKSDKQSGTR